LRTLYVGGFDGEKGFYDLDLEILSDGSCLNPGHPRLKIYTSKSDYDYIIWILWPSALLVVAGASLLVLISVSRLRSEFPQDIAFTDSKTVGQCFQWAQKLPLRRKFTGLPSFGLAAAFVYFLVWVPVCILESQHTTSKGLYVHVLKLTPLVAGNDFRIEPIVVRIAGAGYPREPKVYVNEKQVTWEGLAGALKDELKLRRDWVVYVEADDSVSWANAVSAMDIAEGLHAKVFLLTAKTSP